MRRYWEIAQSLRHEIENGTYAVGDKLPTEEQLRASLGASRHAVREALRVLTEEGFISRRPRAGSIVIGSSPPAPFAHRVGSVRELLNYPINTRRDELSSNFIKTDHELAAVLRCAPDQSWLCFEVIRVVEGSPVPLCHTLVYISPEFAGIKKHKKHNSITYAEQIAELYGVEAESTEIEISSTLISEPTANMLKVSPGDPSLTVIRRYSGSDGKIFEVSIAVHPAQRYAYTFFLKRERPSTKRRNAAKRKGTA